MIVECEECEGYGSIEQEGHTANPYITSPPIYFIKCTVCNGEGSIELEESEDVY